MKIFLDANVLISVLNKEYPFYSDTCRILSLSSHSRFKIFTSPVCLAIAFYYSEKKVGTESAREKINFLSKNIGITTTGSAEVMKTIFNKKIHDFEDGLEYYSALQSGCKCIITEDTEDFYFSDIEVLRSKEFLLKYF